MTCIQKRTDAAGGFAAILKIYVFYIHSIAASRLHATALIILFVSGIPFTCFAIVPSAYRSAEAFIHHREVVLTMKTSVTLRPYHRLTSRVLRDEE